MRPDSWNFPLLLHVLGAMVLVGAAATGAIASLASGAAPEASWLRKVAFRTFLFAALPAYIVMRIAAEWLYSKFPDDLDDPAWIGVGYITADAGAVLLLLILILSGFALRSGRVGLARSAGVIAFLVTVAWLVAVWAMSAKPD
jgi:hypothetical protein